MPTVGVDAHKRVNMAAAIDAAGREVARWRGPNSVEGWRQLAACVLVKRKTGLTIF